ncbi:hypothetical protein BWI96_12120 [Siphonobacter sp. SORGH_AS_0500]|nr:hypothetical protein BWI96_12120 [Siphonobacter sp. SORGH_AS_0500]
MFSSNVLLFPTFFEHENFPTVILEAFSCGIPAISTNWRGVPDQITNDYNGYVHEIHDYEGMKKSILYLFENPTRYEEICLNARNSYLMNYSLEKFENNIVNFFNSLK